MIIKVPSNPHQRFYNTNAGLYFCIYIISSVSYLLYIHIKYVFNSIKGSLLGSPLTNKLVSVNLVYENIAYITTAQSKEARRRDIHRHTSFICEPTSVMNI